MSTPPAQRPDPHTLAWHREQARAAMLENGMKEQCFELLMREMSDGFCVVEMIDTPRGPLSDYRHLYLNVASVRHAGYHRHQGMTVRELIPDEADVWIERFAQVQRTGVSVAFTHELREARRLLTVSVHRLQPVDKRRLAVIFRDRSSSEALLSRNELLEQRMDQAQAERKLFGDVLDSSLANVLVMDKRLILRAINRTARATFQREHGYVPQVGESLEQSLALLPDVGKRMEPLWHRAMAGESVIHVLSIGTRPNQRHYELRMSCLRNDEQKIIGAYLFAYPITERVNEQERLREAEQALRQAQKMEAVGQLTGGIAHDFNNLLGSIQAALELAQQRLRDARPAEAAHLLDSVQLDTGRAASLVQRLLAFSRRQTLQPQATHIPQLVAGLLPLILSSIGNRVRLIDRTPQDLWLTCIDPPQLESALLNLCLNARDAMPEGGTLVIQCENLHIDTELGARLDMPPGDYLHMAVADQGHGMTQEVIERAIDPFFTTKPLGQGTGLGLSMVYGFVRQSGGQMQIQSCPGKGTTVHLYLPRHQAAPQHTLLLIEEQPAMRLVMQEYLEEAGYRVQACGGSGEALCTVRQGLRPSLVICEARLLGQPEGHALIEAIQAAVVNVAAVLLAEPGQPIETPQRLDLEVIGVPVNVQTLVSKVGALLDAAPGPHLAHP
ncbi:PAS domain-containing protein [Pseudomonas sp. S75]|uniref:PAS domain-containing sensor histidine kinase n=1 Tax=unclassified Pseudomonas TaxID=196821 RepID=UPI0019050DBF|nr:MULTISPECIES: PAS domain-containing sensor histidine kinase [unclassified Pseudomonas]MBJ9973876.1 PAS domain-containing protein [Pseudomonas sp. S30]MBK0152194.1 PAS domain-containing protein [Pseudomonas sp. S75]